ncbi:MAG: PqqD family protein [Nocardioides sp.]
MPDTPTNGIRDESQATVWRRATSTAYVESGPGSAPRAVVLDLARPDLLPYVFEGSAAEIWESVNGLRSEAEIVSELARLHDVEEEVVAANVSDFLAELARLHLAEAGAAATP